MYPPPPSIDFEAVALEERARRHHRAQVRVVVFALLAIGLLSAAGIFLVWQILEGVVGPMIGAIR